MFGWSRLTWGLIGAAIGVDLVFVVGVLRRQRSRQRRGEGVTKMGRLLFWACFAVLAALAIVVLGAVERRRRDAAADEARSWREIDRRYVLPTVGSETR